MMATSDILAKYRINTRGPTALGCRSCQVFDLCGGIQPRADAWDCMDDCKKNCEKGCDRVCIRNFPVYVSAIDEVRGLDCQNIGPIIGPTLAPLGYPAYIPTVQHGSAWDRQVGCQGAAIPLRYLMKGSKNVSIKFDSRSHLTETLGLPTDARLLVLGPGPDPDIERYWAFRRMEPFLSRLSALDLDGFIAPNYSYFADDPGTQRLFNRKRSLICAEELASVGIPTIPYLSGITDHDWDFWTAFLKKRPEITVVAKEFQTGLSHPTEGRRAIQKLSMLQRKLERPLHIMLIGAARFLAEIGESLSYWTIIDSSPFIRATKRRCALRQRAHRVDWIPARDAQVSALFENNLRVYSRWIDETAQASAESANRFVRRAS